MEEKCENEKQNVFFGSLGAIFFIDQILFRYALPGFQATRFRFTVNFLKYLVAPCLISYVYRYWYAYEGIILWGSTRYTFTTCRRNTSSVSMIS